MIHLGVHFYRLSLIALPALCVASLWPQAAEAGGFVVPGASPSAQGRAGAFVAKADDPNAITHNVAGFAKQDGTTMYLGANFLRYALRYQRAGVYEDDSDTSPSYAGQPFPEVQNSSSDALGIGGFQLLPALALATDFGKPEWPVRFGFGLYSIQGFPGRSFSDNVTLDDGQSAPAPQRYDVVSQEIVALFPSAAISYSPIDSLDIGVRGTWGYAQAKGSKSIWTIRNYEESPGRDATFSLFDSKDNFVPTFGFGALYRPHHNIEIGVAYNSTGKIRAKGTGASVLGSGTGLGDDVRVVPRDDSDAECAPGGVDGKLKACVSLNIAQNATIGARWIFRDSQGKEKADIEWDLRWEDWSSSSVSEVQVDGQVNVTGMRLNTVENAHGFQDVVSSRVGGSYHLDALSGDLELRGGFAYDTKTAPKSWTRVDQDSKERATFTTGLGYQRGRYRLDIGVGAVWQPDVTVANNCKGPTGPTASDPGCSSDGEAPIEERERPDPGQPLFPANAQKESPFNAGTYKSYYLMFALGLQVAF